MPCSVSDDEIEFYEKNSNSEKYGISDTDERITETVACFLSQLIKKHSLEYELPLYVSKWIEEHELKNSNR